MHFNRRQALFWLQEAFRCALGDYTPWTSLKKQIKWTNLILFIFITLSSLSLLTAGLIRFFIGKDSSIPVEFQHLSMLDVYRGNYQNFLKSFNPDTLFLFALHVQAVKCFFTLIILIAFTYLFKIRHAYSIFLRRRMTKIDQELKERIPNISLDVALNPLFTFTSKYFYQLDLPDQECPIIWENVFNIIFNKTNFPSIKINRPLVRTHNLSFMYHGDFSWDRWLHYILKRFFPTLYKKHLISYNTLTKSQELERNDPRILKGVSVSISLGKFTTILGCNGSGKSVFLKTIIQILEKYQGRIVWIGSELKSISRKSFYKNVAYVDQSNTLQGEMSVYDYVACGLFPSLKFFKFGGTKGDDEVIKNLKKMEILQYKDKSIKHLSGGEMQKAVLARVLTQKTDVIILDEPTTYLDINSQYKILNLLKKLQTEENKTIITVLHDIKQAEQFSDEIILMGEGQVYDYGKTKDIINKKNIEKIFGVPWN